MDETASAPSTGINISKRSYLTSLVVIFALMVVTYILTLVIPAGHYARIPDASGNMVIDQVAGYSPSEGGIPFWKWLLSPFLVLGAAGSGTLIAVIIFLLVIGGVFNSLESSGLMRYMLDRITARFSSSRYKLMAVIILFFMAMGAMIGSFEECVPLVPIVVALAISLGWDNITGMGMSLLAVGCGFAAGVCNPFTIGVAQEIAGLPMFSGIWLRVLAFVLIYGLVLFFVWRHAKRVERPIEQRVGQGFYRYASMDRALICFASILGAGIAIVLSSSFIPALRDYTMVIVALMFLVAGIVSVVVAGMGGKLLGRTFGRGVIIMLPAVLMILMASSIRYTLEEASVLDTILHGAVGLSASIPGWSVILLVYLVALIMNFFVPSGSAEAFMLMPLFVPLAQIFGIPVQLTVVAFAFGDGFSNVFYPTNAALLISLGLAKMGYGEWVKWSWKFQLANLVLTSAILLFGLAVGYH
ncbi:MAG: YfcC family protein [Coriobacteriales bacterium]|nr:YfcC family protein [Coriobacteriales bacterium]MBQ6585733.1 YfcC family protein [Coriobacteriales bacterium]